MTNRTDIAAHSETNILASASQSEAEEEAEDENEDEVKDTQLRMREHDRVYQTVESNTPNQTHPALQTRMEKPPMEENGYS